MYIPSIHLTAQVLRHIEILQNVKDCIDKCIEIAESDHSILASQIKALGIANQRETTVVWDRNTGKPLHNAIVWQDSRTSTTSEQLRSKIDSEKVRRITGLPISSYFSGVKLRWLIDNIPDVRQAVEDGSAMFGTVDSWLVWSLTSERAFITDVTNAGRTMLMNLNSLEWDDEMLRAIDVPRSILPEIRSSSEVLGHLSCTALEGLPIGGVIGDQQAALVGQSCFDVGDTKSTYGTGCFLIVNTGPEPKLSQNGLLTTPAYKLGAESDCIYALEGSIAVAGSAITWLRDGLGVIDNAAESETVAQSVEDTGNVYVVPAFTGLYAPWWNEEARGTIVGITQYTTYKHIVRAVLEAMAFKVDAVLQAASNDMGAPIAELKVDGGVTKNSLVLQMQADVTNTPVVRPKVTETTALGAAFCAGHAVGLFQSKQAFQDAWQLDTRFEPRIDSTTRGQKLRMWNRAVQTAIGWASGDEEDKRNSKRRSLPKDHPYDDRNHQESETKVASSESRSLCAVNFLSREWWLGIILGVCATSVASNVITKYLRK